ncbi:RidA family protein [uncultured Methylibium sp.]|uniref:RidA family protein n=1 Tax=uncultured Methylibium sp. TaxID=381093 RepID=UPI0025E24894|nr:RidA family protein [uncultured Methylibium sp.]
MTTARDALFKKLAAELGIDHAEEVKAVPRYEVAVEHEGELYVSGMIPRVRGAVAVTGSVGADVSLEEGRHAARLCVLRALAVVRQTVGTLDRVKRILRMTVYVKSAANFTEQSEVADAASDILYTVFQPSGGHTRTSIGVLQLPKNAAVEIDMIVALGEREAGTSTF